MDTVTEAEMAISLAVSDKPLVGIHSVAVRSITNEGSVMVWSNGPPHTMSCTVAIELTLYSKC